MLKLFGGGVFNQALLWRWIHIHVNWFGSKIVMSCFSERGFDGILSLQERMKAQFNYFRWSGSLQILFDV